MTPRERRAQCYTCAHAYTIYSAIAPNLHLAACEIGGNVILSLCKPQPATLEQMIDRAALPPPK